MREIINTIIFEAENVRNTFSLPTFFVLCRYFGLWRINIFCIYSSKPYVMQHTVCFFTYHDTLSYHPFYNSAFFKLCIINKFQLTVSYKFLMFLLEKTLCVFTQRYNNFVWQQKVLDTSCNRRVLNSVILS